MKTSLALLPHAGITLNGDLCKISGAVLDQVYRVAARSLKEMLNPRPEHLFTMLEST